MNPAKFAVCSAFVLSSLSSALLVARDPIPAGLRDAIGASQHAIARDGTGYQGYNSEQDLHLRFEAASAAITVAAGQLRVCLSAMGRGARLSPVSPARLTAGGSRVDYVRGPLTEWYENNSGGLEQGFTLAERPAGTGAVVLALRVEGGLTPRIDGSRSVRLERNGKTVLRYTGLTAWDSHQRALPVSMAVEGSEIRLKVDDAGAAYPVTIDPWVQQAKLSPPDGASRDHFGGAVALSGDTAVVGAAGRSSGTGGAYVYVRNGAVWTLQATLTAPDGAPYDAFGYAVAVSGDTAIVGAEEALGLAGAAYVFVRSGTTWTLQAKLTAADGVSGAVFGNSVALEGDSAVVGADGAAGGAGAAYIFTRTGTVWTQQAKLTASDGAALDSFGSSVALSGQSALIGAVGKNSYTGAAYVFVQSGGEWVQQAELTAPSPDGAFGDSVGLSGDTALVGESFANSAYVYVRNGTLWTLQATFRGEGAGSTFNAFGHAVAVSQDTALVGEWGLSGSTGAAYLFVRSGTVWTEQAKLTAADAAPSDGFGYAVALSGDTALAGAIYKGGPGKAYVFLNQNTPASLTLSSSAASPLTNLALSGGGFAPNETIALSYTSAAQVPLGTATADAAGRFTASVRLPLTGYSNGYIAAAGQSSALTGAANFRVTPRLMVTPNVGTPGSTVLAQGVGFGAGETVSIYWEQPHQDVLLGTVTADSKGGFLQGAGLTFTIPAGSRPGTYSVVGKGANTRIAVGARVSVQ